MPARFPSAAPWATALLAGVCVAVYLNALPNGFVYDDHRFIAQNASITRLANIPRFLVSFEGTGGSREIYRPLRSASYALDYHLWGRNPLGFHFVNLLLHIVNAALLFLLATRLAGSTAVAGGAALLFALHPVQTESVAWASSRADLLFAAFCFLSLWFYAESAIRRIGYAASLLCFGLALLSKEHAMCLPLLLVMYDLWRGRRPWTRWLGFFALAMLYFLVRTWLSGQVGQKDYWGGGLYPTALTACRMVFRYVGLMCAPVHLSVDWQPVVSHSLSEPAAHASVVALAAGLAWAVWCLLRGGWTALGVLWFLIALLPVSNFVPLKSLLAERFLYLPSAGFCLLAAGAFQGPTRARRPWSTLPQIRNLREVRRCQATDQTWRAWCALAIALCVLFAGRAIHRNHDWRNDYTLFGQTALVCPGSYKAYYNVGLEYHAARLYERARVAYQKAVRIHPRYASAALNLGVCYRAKGMMNEAIAAWRLAAESDPGLTLARVNLANAYRARGDLDAALKEYLAVANAVESPADAQNEIGNILYQKGELDSAVQAYRRALSLNAQHPEARFNLACAYLKMGQAEAAIAEFLGHLRLRPCDAEAHNRLGNAYVHVGNWLKAIEAYQTTLKLNPNLTMIHFNLGAAYAHQGRPKDAIASYETFLSKWKGSADQAEAARARIAALKASMGR